MNSILTILAVRISLTIFLKCCLKVSLSLDYVQLHSTHLDFSHILVSKKSTASSKGRVVAWQLYLQFLREALFQTKQISFQIFFGGGGGGVI